MASVHRVVAVPGVPRQHGSSLLGVCRRRRVDDCRHGAMAVDAGGWGAYRIVQGTPVARLGVLPRPVVEKSRWVSQRWCWRGRVNRAGVGRRSERERHGGSQAEGVFCHFQSDLNRRQRSAQARAAARAPSGLSRRPPWVRCFGEVALGRPTQSSVAERRGWERPQQRAVARQP